MVLVAVAVAVLLGVHQQSMKVALVAVLESWDKELAVLVEFKTLLVATLVLVALVEQLVELMVAQVVHMAVVVAVVIGINLEVAQPSVQQAVLVQ
jgi:hypothetical protein